MRRSQTSHLDSAFRKLVSIAYYSQSLQRRLSCPRAIPISFSCCLRRNDCLRLLAGRPRLTASPKLNGACWPSSNATEGLKQVRSRVELLEVQPITLTRLIDKLCENDLIERREDAGDRRVNRLYLRPAARPLLEKLGELRSEITETALGHISADEANELVRQLEIHQEQRTRRTARRRQ